jgi:hypothetical protein
LKDKGTTVERWQSQRNPREAMKEIPHNIPMVSPPGSGKTMLGASEANLSVGYPLNLKGKSRHLWIIG